MSDVVTLSDRMPEYRVENVHVVNELIKVR